MKVLEFSADKVKGFNAQHEAGGGKTDLNWSLPATDSFNAQHEAGGQNTDETDYQVRVCFNAQHEAGGGKTDKGVNQTHQDYGFNAQHEAGGAKLDWRLGLWAMPVFQCPA